MFNFYSTAGLIFGNETSLNSCSQIIDTLGKNIFVVSDRGLTELGLIEPTIKKLKKNIRNGTDIIITFCRFYIESNLSGVA